MKQFENAVNKISYYSLKVSEATIVLLLVIIVSTVIARYAFDYGILWSFETSQYLQVILVFLPMVYLLLEDRHIRITLGRDILPKRLKIIPDVIASLGGLAFSGYFLKLSIESVLQDIKAGSASPVAGVPTFIPVAVVALGTLLLCIGFLFKLVMGPRAKEKALGAKESALVAAVKESRIEEIRDAS